MNPLVQLERWSLSITVLLAKFFNIMPKYFFANADFYANENSLAVFKKCSSKKKKSLIYFLCSCPGSRKVWMELLQEVCLVSAAPHWSACIYFRSSLPCVYWKQSDVPWKYGTSCRLPISRACADERPVLCGNKMHAHRHTHTCIHATTATPSGLAVS